MENVLAQRYERSALRKEESQIVPGATGGLDRVFFRQRVIEERGGSVQGAKAFAFAVAKGGKKLPY